jgi:hypothetical protein
MYFANNYYLMRYDGVKWDKYSLPNKTIIRSILVEGDAFIQALTKNLDIGIGKRKMNYV